jgi:hypothetical protein
MVAKPMFAQCTTEVKTLCNGGAYELKIPTGFVDIQWFFDNGLGQKTINAPRGTQSVLLADSVGTYSFTARDSNGCFVSLCCPFQLIPSTPMIILTQPVSIIGCINANQMLSVNMVGDSSSFLYQWQISVDSTNWTNILNATNRNFKPNSQNIGQIFYRVFIKDNINFCDSLYSKVVSVNIVPKPTISVSTATPSVCKGYSVTLNARVVDGTGTCHIQWQSSLDNGLNWQNIQGATSNTFQTPPLNNSTLFQAALSCSASNCCLK